MVENMVVAFADELMRKIDIGMDRLTYISLVRWHKVHRRVPNMTCKWFKTYRAKCSDVGFKYACLYAISKVNKTKDGRGY